MSDDLPLPDDLWRKILDLGIKNTELTYKDLCSISITSRGLNQLSGEDSLWSHLLSNDFPRRIPFSSSLWYPFRVDPLPSVSVEEIANQPSSSSAKSQYRIRLEIERERERELKARRRSFFEELEQLYRELFEVLERPEHRWAVLQEENDLFDILSAPVRRRAVFQEGNDLFGILSAKIQEIELTEEKQTRKATAADLFISTKANSSGFERVPDRPYPKDCVSLQDSAVECRLFMALKIDLFIVGNIPRRLSVNVANVFEY